MPPKFTPYLFEERDFARGTKMLVIDERNKEVVARVVVVSTARKPDSALAVFVKDSPEGSELEFELSLHSSLIPFWFIVSHPNGGDAPPRKDASGCQFVYDHPSTHKQLGLALHDETQHLVP